MTAGAVHRLPAEGTYDAVAGQSAAVVIRNYSTSFGLATRLLGEPVRSHVRNIYALVRIADEIVDSPDLGLGVGDRAELLDLLHEDTLRAMRHGHSTNLVVHAFAGTARATGIGPDLVDPFFASMRSDLSASTHDSASLDRYIYGSAEVVGLMCLRVFLADAGEAPPYADLAPGARRLGAAFQKVNFLRDLAHDRGVLGRSYFDLPAGADLTDAQRDTILDDIDADLAAAAVAIASLPVSSRRAVRAAYLLFSELSSRLRATPAGQITSTRVSVPGSVKARLVARAFLSGGSR
jgi:phytoene/squalene synthetase